MDYIIAAIVGGIIGYLASMVMNMREGVIANIIIGVVGAALGRWLFGDVLGIGGAAVAGSFSWVGLFWGIVGAVLLIAVLKFFRLMGSSR